MLTDRPSRDFGQLSAPKLPPCRQQGYDQNFSRRRFHSAAYRSGKGQNFPCENPSASIPNARFIRARRFSQAIAAVSSTIWRSEKSRRRAANNSSETLAGVRVSAVARRSTFFSVPLKFALDSNPAISRNCVSLNSFSFLPTAEWMSIQNGQPTSMAVLSIAKRLKRFGNSPFASE